MPKTTATINAERIEAIIQEVARPRILREDAGLYRECARAIVEAFPELQQQAQELQSCRLSELRR